MAGDFPQKPMGLYATIWDASDWATSGGRYKVNYKYAPFAAHFTDLVLRGCAADPLQQIVADNHPAAACDDADLEAADFATVNPKQRRAMKRFRQKYMYYSYCYDSVRYAVPPPECVVDAAERGQFKETGRLKFEKRHHRRGKRSSRSEVFESSNYGSNNQDED